MKSLVQFSLKQVVFFNVAFVLLMVSGIYSLLTNPVENLPPVDMGQVVITTVYYGASAEDIENLISRKIEKALDGIENIEYVRSTSNRNYSTVEVKFIDDTDYRKLYNEIRFKIQNIRNELPENADESIYTYIDTQIWMPVIIVNLTGDLPNRSLKLLADELKTRLKLIAFVKDVPISGQYKNEFHISLDHQKLRQYGITFQQAVNAVQSANTKIPTGRLQHGNLEYMLDAGGRISSQEAALDVVIRRDGDGNFIRVRDVVTSARVSHRMAEVIASVNGENTIQLKILKEAEGNSITIAETVQEIATTFEHDHQQDAISIAYTHDSTIEIHDSINTLTGNLILGIIMVIIVLWLTLGFSNAMITAVGIPFSFLVCLIMVKFTGQSINTISLFSFVLVSGIIVDDAIIALENIHRHLEMGKNINTAIIDGISEVMLPIITSSVTTILAFIPMLVMTGTTGDFFSVIPKAVTYALLASLFEALFILPIHVKDWTPKKNLNAITANQPTVNEDPYQHLKTGLFATLWKSYFNILNVLLAHQIKTLLAVTALFFLSLTLLGLSITGVVPLLKVDFFPGSVFRYHVAISLPTGANVAQTDEVVKNLSQVIMSFGTRQALSASGIAGVMEDEDYVHHNGHHYGQIIVTLPKKAEQAFPDNPDNDAWQHINFIRDKLNQYITQHYSDPTIKPTLRIFPENTGPPTGKAINIRISGSRLEDARQVTRKLLDYIKKEPEFKDLVDLEDNRAHLQKVVKYQPLPEATYEHGLTPDAVTRAIAGILNGQYAGEFRTKDEEIDLIVRVARLDDKDNYTGKGIADPSDVLDIPIVEHSASPIFLRDVADLKYHVEPSIRTRYNGKPAISIKSDIKEGSALSVSRVQVLVKQHYKTIRDQYPGVSVTFGGEFETTSRAYNSLIFAFFIAVFAIYMVLTLQFNDYIQPMIIISAIVFAFIGVVLGMFITQSTFTVGSFLAVVGLSGVAVNDCLILIDFINVRRGEGKPVRTAINEACAARMRPVLITTLTTMLGLLPMAIGIPHKSISWSPMATAFVTGLSCATLLTLFIVPVEYMLTEKIKRWVQIKLTRHH